MKMLSLKIIVGTMFLVMLTTGDSIISSNAHGATITGQTSMTVVNVDNWIYGDKSTWKADRVYINNVHVVGYSHITWNMTPNPLPFAALPDTVAGVISAVYTFNGGISWTSIAWDYIGRYTTGKHSHDQVPGNSQWVGTFISGLCEQDPVTCTARERSNVYFTTETF